MYRLIKFSLKKLLTVVRMLRGRIVKSGVGTSTAYYKIEIQNII